MDENEGLERSYGVAGNDHCIPIAIVNLIVVLIGIPSVCVAVPYRRMSPCDLCDPTPIKVLVALQPRR